ncbi:MAG: LysR substrate-binding domain-containing protein [Polyangiales bacterium]
MLQELDDASTPRRGEQGTPVASDPPRGARRARCGSSPGAGPLAPSLPASTWPSRPRPAASRCSKRTTTPPCASARSPSSQLLARRLGAVSLVLAARPARAAAVLSLADLRASEHVRVEGFGATLGGTLRGRAVRVPVRGRMQVPTFSEAAALAACSDRVAVIPSFTAVEWLRDGRLARALPRLRLPSAPVHLLYPARHRGSPLLRDLGDLLTTALAQAEDAVR